MSTDFLFGITVLLVYQLIGEIITRLLQLPVPGPVIGMLLLFASLFLHHNLEQRLDAASASLLTHLSLLFVPAGVGVMAHFGRLEEQWLPILVALVLGTLLTLAATALIMLGVSRLLGHGGKTGHE
ncbi:MAG: CidA/LrgA family protein [Thiothrix sp.]|nr:CidA/LrgA family protein [Thiothrix sp.]HPQ94258.1 CidA/LrgA family protein [Thiolinea sp.]